MSSKQMSYQLPCDLIGYISKNSWNFWFVRISAKKQKNNENEKSLILVKPKILKQQQKQKQLLFW